MYNNFNQVAKIKVIGVGGGGCNAINRMMAENVQGVEFIVANTDAQVLAQSNCSKKITIGEKISKGLGAGANPEIGRLAALESESEIRQALVGADLIFVAAGMGGGTGTGAAPEIARIAMETGALVVAIVTKPFRFEGKMRNSYAINGLIELRKYIDSIITISNDRLLEIIGNLPIKDSFKEADNILKQGVQTITDLIAIPAVINLDFADVKTIMKEKGNALFGIGLGTGPDKAIEAANKAINSSLLETTIRGTKDAIINVTGGPTVSLNDAYDAVDIIQQASGEDINIIFGISINESLGDEIIVTVIATGDDEEYQLARKQVKLEVESRLVKTLEANINAEKILPRAQEPIKQGPTLQEAFDARLQNTATLENPIIDIQDTGEDYEYDDDDDDIPKSLDVKHVDTNTIAQFTNQESNEDHDDDEEDEDFPTFLRKNW
ncbi:cell division protein FtsZ [Spiroplasma endosymbiont of Crioceris asparagi]|uniref:cell division protein FtsZ n=1 Tax=Spiroplasma endosymbiont of Crioceris asparagi TaxID=3066286 RepID=UPI0030CE496F